MGKHSQNIENNFNQELCDMLNEIALYEKNVSGNIYKYNAYKQAAKVLAKHPSKISSGKEALKLIGIGKSIAEKIDSYLSSGKIPKLVKIQKDKNYKVIQLLTQISGIGRCKAKDLADKGIKTLQDLEKIKSTLTHHQQIGLKYFVDFQQKIPRSEVYDFEKAIVKEVACIDDDYIVTICGSYRRGKPKCHDIDCLITHPSYTSDIERKKKGETIHDSMLKRVVKKLVDAGIIIDTIALGKTKFMGVCKRNSKSPARRLDIRLTPHDQYFCGILYFTGSDLFNKNMRAHAFQKGFTLNEYALRPVGETGVLGEPIPLTCEKDIFYCIDYPYKPPDERDF